MSPRSAFLFAAVAVLGAAVGFAQIPEAPGNESSAPRDEHPGHSSGRLEPAVVPTEREATPPEIVDLMNRSRANAEATKTGLKSKRGNAPKRRATPAS